MKRDIRIIALDLDETTFTPQKEISPRVLAAIERAIGQGIAVVPATGRHLQSVPENIRAIRGLRYVMTSNGARVCDITTGETLYEDCIGGATAQEVLRQARLHDCLLGAYIDGMGYSERRDMAFFEALMTPSLETLLYKNRIQVPDLAAHIGQSGKPVEKFCFYYGDMAARRAAYEAFEARGDVAVTASAKFNIEVNSRTANKGTALLALAEKLGVAPGQTMGVGDSSNDLELMKLAGWGVAMANAEPEIKAAADWVTLSNLEDGVAVAIEAVL